ncbi:MAG: DUF2247 family protein [Bacteroidota bacterium]
MMKKENLRVTWGVLLVGLEKDWLAPLEVVKLVNEHSSELALDEDLLVEFNVNEDDKSSIIDLLKTKGELEKEQAIKYWQQSELMTIEQSDKPIEEKLKDIELQWSKFDYPEDWRDFIYYLPNEKSSSNEGIYQIFLNYLNHVPDR